MTVAYVLMKCELGAEEEVIEKLKEMEEVLWVDQTYGAYDLIAKVESGNIEKLKEFLTWNIQKMDKIRSTLTVNRKGS
ncbi:MAG: Lrp/AsnC ligand binding domain-containing protein [Nitrosopumilaceae archaeon]|nr:Lrp/AsnC ligand binding domain-containing protein [Nitrosopumilaceae archaeon]